MASSTTQSLSQATTIDPSSPGPSSGSTTQPLSQATTIDPSSPGPSSGSTTQSLPQAMTIDPSSPGQGVSSSPVPGLPESKKSLSFLIPSTDSSASSSPTPLNSPSGPTLSSQDLKTQPVLEKLSTLVSKLDVLSRNIDACDDIEGMLERLGLIEFWVDTTMVLDCKLPIPPP